MEERKEPQKEWEARVLEKRYILNIFNKLREHLIYCEKSVIPENNGIAYYGGATKFERILMRDLFLALGIEEERLAEVYESSLEYVDGEVCVVYTGSFREDGKQKLSNILGKNLEFYEEDTTTEEKVSSTYSSSGTFYPEGESRFV